MCGPYPMHVWVIDHDSPDFPAGLYSLRCYTATHTMTAPSRVSCLCASLDEARSSVPPECGRRLPRHKGDRPSLVETWE